MNMTKENSVILENYNLNDDYGKDFEVIAKYFYLPNMYDPKNDKRYEILTRDDLKV